MPPNATKPQLRELIRAALRARDDSINRLESRSLLTLLVGVQQIASAAALLAFSPTADEPDISPLFEQRARRGLATALPRTVWESRQIDPVLVHNLSADCSPTRYSILQPNADLPPLPLDRLDVVLVPGVAFDLLGNRLGRGGGFYDRFLARVVAARAQCLLVGICFDEQIVDLVPTAAHDVRVGMIVTPARTLVCGG